MKPLCLIGMSGVGKSHWARALHLQRGYVWHDCDAMIAARLDDVVHGFRPDEAAVHAVGRWMGMPWSEGYAERERAYVGLEHDVTQQALSSAVRESAHTRQVIDTTGSVVHLDETLQKQLAQACNVIYLRVSASMHAEMLTRYLTEPKPVIWDGCFDQLADETPEQSLARCYPVLLQERDRRYERLAEVTIGYDDLQTQSEQVVLDRLMQAK